MKSIDVKLTSVEVKSEVRQLRCNWCVELVKEIQSFHSMGDIESLQRRVSRMGSMVKVFNINVFKIDKK